MNRYYCANVIWRVKFLHRWGMMLLHLGAQKHRCFQSLRNHGNWTSLQIGWTHISLVQTTRTQRLIQSYSIRYTGTPTVNVLNVSCSMFSSFVLPWFGWQSEPFGSCSYMALWLWNFVVDGNAKELDADHKKVSTMLAEHSAAVLLSIQQSKTCIAEGTLVWSLMLYDGTVGISVTRRQHRFLTRYDMESNQYDSQ